MENGEVRNENLRKSVKSASSACFFYRKDRKELRKGRKEIRRLDD